MITATSSSSGDYAHILEGKRKVASASHFPTALEFSKLADIKVEFCLSFPRRKHFAALGFFFLSFYSCSRLRDCTALVLLPLQSTCSALAGHSALQISTVYLTRHSPNYVVANGSLRRAFLSLYFGQLNEDQCKLLLGGPAYFSSCSLHKHWAIVFRERQESEKLLSQQILNARLLFWNCPLG